MDNERREIRFFIDKDIYDKLKEEAKALDIPLASYIKSNISEWGKNVRRRTKNK